jgi:hypothetical protein
MSGARIGTRLLAALLALALPQQRAEAASGVVLPDREEAEDALPEGGSLTGREIFDRFLENRLHSAVQYQTGFLMVVNEDRSNDQFVWTPSSGRVRRVQLRGIGVMGTDYTFDDIAWRNVEDAEYRRLPDEQIDGTDVYVVEVTMKPFVDSQYRTMRTWIEKQHYVPLRSVYRDENGVEIREMRAPRSGIREFEGTWVASDSTMFNLKEKTSTRVLVDKLDANVALADQHFSTLQLTLRR